MANCSHKKNPLQRNGTDQRQRLLPGMQNGYVAVDEKRFADWIDFANRFAKYIKYYDLNGVQAGDWSAFFNSDISAVLGMMAIQDVEAYKSMIREHFDYLKDDTYALNILPAKKKLNELFGIVLTFSKALDDLCQMLSNDESVKETINRLVISSLASSLKRLLQYYKASEELGLLEESNDSNLRIFGVNQVPAKSIVESGLSDIWWSGNAGLSSWGEFYAGITPEKSIFGDTTITTAFMQINHAANHNLFAGIFDQFLKALGKLVKDAGDALLLSIENNNSHAPHYALFLTFLHLFRYVQKDINAVTHRHLDFYYKEVLRLNQKPAVANSAHILLELAKPVSDVVLAANTQFKAGKDSSGKEVIYSLARETTFNKAKVASLRSVYFGSAADDDFGGSRFAGRLFAAPVINSADGVGAELASAHKEWRPMANKLYIEGKVREIKMPQAQIGFAIASHYLYLQEGQRNISLRLATSNNSQILLKQFEIYVTIEKGWHRITSPIETTLSKLSNGAPCVELSFSLAGDEPPTFNYHPELHSGTLGVNVPAVKVILQNIPSKPYEYGQMRELKLNQFEVVVNVGQTSGSFDQTGLKQLYVSTDGGVVDTSKPFMPFGPYGIRDSAFVIGNKELFSKKNTRTQLNIDWANFPANTAGLAYGTALLPAVKVRFLQKGVWDNSQDLDAVQIFNEGFQKVVNLTFLKDVISGYDEEYTVFNPASVNGFVKLMLVTDFGYKDYLQELSRYYVTQATEDKGDDFTKPTAPYLPIIQSLYVSYTAVSDIVDLNNANEYSPGQGNSSFFHIYPFGDSMQHRFISGPSGIYLLPQFHHLDEDACIVEHEGEFYIGFENLAANQSVNVLFQVLDGSADPAVTKPDGHIHWSYLSANKWLAFDKQNINDGTGQLVQSGIISFIIPADATTNNTILPAGLLWIRCAVKEKVDALCKLILVNAQAATVRFEDNGNAADFMGGTLPAETITKLKIPQADVKKVVQPYSSFGGKPMETNDAFYIRVSERLRHKARAVTIWDYEHLILEAFPEIHKVKCLNHTKSVDAVYNEVAPGHVTIITIPDLKQRNDVNPLKPYTSQNVLKAIENFLVRRISCHVKLHVVNPVFEEVLIKFKLRLAKGFDDFTIYSNRLRDEITGFLSPWAHSNDVEINFGGSISKSVLINFIEERPYVDFITNVELSHISAEGVVIVADADQVIASNGKCILVSVPASKHIIGELLPESLEEFPECDYLTGIQHHNQ